MKNKEILDSIEAFDAEVEQGDDGFDLDLRVYAQQAISWATQPGNPIVPLAALAVAVGLGVHLPNGSYCC